MLDWWIQPPLYLCNFPDSFFFFFFNTVLIHIFVRKKNKQTKKAGVWQLLSVTKETNFSKSRLSRKQECRCRVWKQCCPGRSSVWRKKISLPPGILSWFFPLYTAQWEEGWFSAPFLCRNSFLITFPIQCQTYLNILSEVSKMECESWPWNM